MLQSITKNGSPFETFWTSFGQDNIWQYNNKGVIIGGSGTYDPAYKLNVTGGVNAGGTVNASQYLINGQPLNTFFQQVGQGENIYYHGNVTIGGTIPMTSDFQLKVIGRVDAGELFIGGTSIDEKLFWKKYTPSSPNIIFNGGNVSIGGGTDPIYKLDVFGQINGTDLLINGNSVNTSLNNITSSVTTLSTDFNTFKTSTTQQFSDINSQFSSLNPWSLTGNSGTNASNTITFYILVQYIVLS